MKNLMLWLWIFLLIWELTGVDETDFRLVYDYYYALKVIEIGKNKMYEIRNGHFGKNTLHPIKALLPELIKLLDKYEETQKDTIPSFMFLEIKKFYKNEEELCPIIVEKAEFPHIFEVIELFFFFILAFYVRPTKKLSANTLVLGSFAFLLAQDTLSEIDYFYSKKKCFCNFPKMGQKHTPPCGCGYRNKIVAVAVAVEPQTATNFQFFWNLC